jgi:hypothetical protein
LPVSSETSSLKCENGVVRCPSGVGFGVTIDPDFVKRAEVVTAAPRLKPASRGPGSSNRE